MSNRYFKRNYDEIVDILTPSIYKEKDIELSGVQVDVVDRVSSSLINLIRACTEVGVVPRVPLNFSGTNIVDQLSSFSGLASRFIKSNNLTELSPRDFELKILNPLGKQFSDFTTSSEFSDYLSGTLLPAIPAYGVIHRRSTTPPYLPTVINLADSTASAFATSVQRTHDYLLDALSWFYLLNQPAGYGNAGEGFEFYDPSSALLDVYVEKLFKGETLKLNDAIKTIWKYLWLNQRGRCVSGVAGEYGEELFGKFIDEAYASGTGTWVSGNQQIEKYYTLLDVIFEDKYASVDDTYLRDLLQEYVDSGAKPDSTERAAPFSKLMRAVSFMMADINDFNEKLRAVKSIDDCPAELLPYLADLIGWKFYNNDIKSWRRQLRNAVDLYKKKGTKEGLIGLINSILPGNGIDLQQAISEFYESYIPQLMFYLLATASPQFNDLQTWTHKKSLEFNRGEYDSTNLEQNIRYTVDHILLRAVQKFPDLFNVRGYKFDISSSSFKFNYRGREFSIPPWEEEKFYVDCDINEDLVEFFSQELKCLGVSGQYVDNFKNFILSNTVSGDQPLYKYNNTFLFFTKDLTLPPNHDYIINSFDKRRIKYLPLWNSKSSHFDFTVSGAGFDLEFFSSPNYNRYDFTNSLLAVPDFSPAKAIPRVHVDISGVEQVSSGDYMFPKVKYSFVDLQAPSGAAASWQASGLDMRSAALGLRGADLYRPPAFTEDLTKTHINHLGLACFLRDQVEWGVTPISLNPLTASGPYTAEAPRTAVRRRDYSKSLTRGEWYSRTGYNQPSFYNGVSSTTSVTYDPYNSDDILYEYLPLGWIPSSYTYTPVTFPLSGVWNSCETVDSSSLFNGVETSACYEIRGSIGYAGTSSIEKDKEHFYVDRSNTPEIIFLIYKLIEEKARAKAKVMYEKNKFLLTDSYQDPIESLTNIILEEEDYQIHNYYDFEFGNIKPKCRELFIGIHRLYDSYIKDLGFHSIADSELNSLEDGGLSVISHAYGPLVYNSKSTIEGSEYNQNYNKKSGSVSDEFVFPTTSACVTDYYEANTTRDLYTGSNTERRCYGYLSGVEIVDVAGSPNVISCFNLSSDRSLLGGSTLLVGKNTLAMKSLRHLPRLRYHVGPDNGSGPTYGPRSNKLVPEHEFSLQLSSQFLEEYTNKKGGGNVGVWIHTLPEQDANGEYVFWNYMPNGTWQMQKASDVAGNRTGITKVKNELCHTISLSRASLISNPTTTCYESGSESAKLALLSLNEEDISVDNLSFNTKNRLIKTPLSYYRKYQQVHRKDQNYVVEIFAIPSNEGATERDTKRYWIFQGFNIVDNYFHACLNTVETFDVPDFEASKSATVSSTIFYKTNGDIVPLGTIMEIDLSGNITLEGEKITYGYTSPVVQSPEKPKLYSTVNAYIKSRWISENLLVDSMTTSSIFIDNVGYTGKFSQESDYGLLPSSLGLIGKDLGSHMTTEATAHYMIDPENLLRAFRYFRYISEQISSRDHQETESLYGLSGGGRLNYRIHPESYLNDPTYYYFNNRYNELEFYN